MGHYEDRPEYDSLFDDEDPRAKLYRAEWDAEKRALSVIDRLLESLTAKDAAVQLFTFAERVQWGLRRNARRSRPSAE